MLPVTAPANTPDQDRCRAALREAAARRSEAAGERRAATLELATWCRHARSAGLSIAETARLGGISRETTYRLLELVEPDPEGVDAS